MRRWVISAFDELRDLGHLGRECLKLINKLTREEVARFPALTPEGGWQRADLEDLVGKFLTERLEKVIANLLALAGDDASVGRLLRKSIRCWLIDQARQTAWRSGRMPPARFADEFVAHLAAVNELDPDGATQAVQRHRDVLLQSPDGRTALRRFANDRRLGWHSVGIQQSDSTATPPTDITQALSRDLVLPALVDLADATDLTNAQQATTNLVRSVTEQEVSKRDLWSAIATAAAEAVRAGDLPFAVTITLPAK